MSEDYYMDEDESFLGFLESTNWDELEHFVKILSCQKEEVYQPILEHFHSFKTDKEKQEEYEHYYPSWCELTFESLSEQNAMGVFYQCIDDANDALNTISDYVADGFMDGFSWEYDDETHISEGCKLVSKYAQKAGYVFYMGFVEDEDSHCYGFIRKADVKKLKQLPGEYSLNIELF